ncbi:MAG: DUF1254 domain-containing protein [Glycocaulis sp.]
MNRKTRNLVILSGVALTTLAVLAAGWSWSTRNPAGQSLRALGEAAGHGYVYGYPLLVMDETRQATGLPPNMLYHARSLPGAGFTAVVRPNTDTLYSIAWLDLGAGPQMLDIPPMDGRYWLFQGLDAWTNVFADPGSRTLGDGDVRILIAGPDWQGEAPESVTLYRAPTAMVWLLGRIEIDGADDLEAVHALQDRLSLRPLEPGAASLPVAPQTPGVLPPPEAVRGLDAEAFFARLAGLMATNPPDAEDSAMLDQLSAIGVAPGEDMDWTGFGPLALAAMTQGVRTARERLDAGPPRQDGWTVPAPHIGRYGTDYAYRAGVALYGLGANLPEDALYPSTLTDEGGAPLIGGQTYRIRFAPRQLPPVNAFWSITLYDAEGYLIANPAGRYAVSSRDHLVTDADGGLTLDVHSGPPAPGREANWLPAPQTGEFNLLARLYWPHEDALAGDWQVPPVERLD